MSEEQATTDPLAGAAAAAETLLSSVPDVAYLLDRSGQLRWWNDRLRSVTGYGDEHLDGLRFEELLAPDERGAAREAFERILSSADADRPGSDGPPGSRPAEYDLWTASGERLPHEFVAGTVTDGGDAVGLAVVGRDVSAHADWRAELRRRRDQSQTLYHVGEAAGEVIDALVEAGTREELERRVCETIFASGRYRAVWVGQVEDGRVVPTVSRAELDGFVEAASQLDDVAGWTRPLQRAVETGAVETVRDVQHADVPAVVKEVAAAADIASGAAVPLVHRGTVHGVLGVYSSNPDAFSDRERTAFARLGRYVGFAIHAVRTERLLLGDPGTELVFEVPHVDRPLYHLSAEHDCTCRFEWATPDHGGRMRHYLSFEGVAVDAVGRMLEESDGAESYRIVSRDDAGENCLVEVIVADSQARRIVDAGGRIREYVVENGRGRVVVSVHDSDDASAVADSVADYYSDARLVAKRPSTDPAPGDGPLATLTDRQLEALSTAYRAGYFEWPRDRDAEAVAEELDISSATFHYHLRGALRSLLDEMLDPLDS